LRCCVAGDEQRGVRRGLRRIGGVGVCLAEGRFIRLEGGGGGERVARDAGLGSGVRQRWWRMLGRKGVRCGCGRGTWGGASGRGAGRVGGGGGWGRGRLGSRWVREGGWPWRGRGRGDAGRGGGWAGGVGNGSGGGGGGVARLARPAVGGVPGAAPVSFPRETAWRSGVGGLRAGGLGAVEVARGGPLCDGPDRRSGWVPAGGGVAGRPVGRARAGVGRASGRLGGRSVPGGDGGGGGGG